MEQQIVKCLVLGESGQSRNPMIEVRIHLVRDNDKAVVLKTSGVEVGVLDGKTLKITLMQSNGKSHEVIELPGWDRRDRFWYFADNDQRAIDIQRAFLMGYAERGRSR